ncbi:MAG TPA: DUF72 domain-containing protein [Actinomycetes bacterium]|nr:DUF72 domain-containing protein [Actinomycetes bacterium]
MRPSDIHVGTSGWQYRDWRGEFYPPKLPQKQWLEYYATQFDVVEVDATFYRLPDRNVFESWRSRTPEHFRFVVKASRFLTHVKRLKQPAEPVERLLDRANGLGPNLAAVLLQLPPTMGAAPDLLAETLSAFGRTRVAVELRHDSWWSGETKAVLNEYRAATVWADRKSRHLNPLWQTGGWGYLRMHEGTATPWPSYGREALQSWSGRLQKAARSWDDGYVFFNNDPGGAAPRNARYLVRQLSAG